MADVRTAWLVVAMALTAIISCAKAASAQAFEELRAGFYAENDTAKRVKTAEEMLKLQPGEALDELGRFLRGPVGRFNEEIQRQICLLLARRADDASLDVILKKQKENSERALWIVEEALASVKDRARISRLIPGMLANMRPADRELGFYLIEKMALTEHKDLLVKALVQERNRPAFEQAAAAVRAIGKSSKVGSTLIASLHLLPTFEDRLAAMQALGDSGDISALTSLIKMLGAESEDDRCIAIEALSRLKREEALKAAVTILAPAGGEVAAIPPRNRLKGFALVAMLRFPATQTSAQISALLKPHAAFVFDSDGYTVDSRIRLLEWIAANPDARYAADIEAIVRSDGSNRHRAKAAEVLGMLKRPESVAVLKEQSEKGETGATRGLGAAGGEEAESHLIAKLDAIVAAGLDTDPTQALTCIETLGAFTSAASIEALGRLVALEKVPFSVEALKQLARSTDAGAKARVTGALTSGSETMRRAACILLGSHGDSSSLKTLDSITRRDASAAVRAAAKAAAADIRSRAALSGQRR